MNTIFKKGPSLVNRLLMALFFSTGLIVTDHYFDGFAQARVFVNSLVSPIQYLASLPGQLLRVSAGRLVSHEKLLSDKAVLTEQNVRMSEQLQRFEVLKAENQRLRALLGSPAKVDLPIMVTELMAVDNNPFSLQIVIDKGAIHGVYEGQPVLDEHGVVGQIMQVGSTNSRVLLVADLTHGVPLRLLRNNVRYVATGSGTLNELYLEHVPHSADIKQGDQLITSGLGKVYPQGYPVGVVKSVTRDEARPFAKVVLTPSAQLDRIKYLLLVWPENAPNPPIFDSEQEQ